MYQVGFINELQVDFKHIYLHLPSTGVFSLRELIVIHRFIETDGAEIYTIRAVLTTGSLSIYCIFW